MHPLRLLKHPAAYLPIAMSLGALGAIGAHLILHGAAPQSDEGAAAHIWQLLMALQVPVVLYFAIKWLPRSPREALTVLALQAAAGLAAAAPVLLLHW